MDTSNFPKTAEEAKELQRAYRHETFVDSNNGLIPEPGENGLTSHSISETSKSDMSGH